MFVIMLTYTAAISEIDERLPEHVAWLDAHYESGVFLASGRRVPRVGGVILAAASVGRQELDRILDGDPFRRDGLARYDVVEFAPSRTAKGLEALAAG